MPAKLYRLKTNAFEIKPIAASETYAIRHAVLRQGKPLSTCIFNGDELSNTFHFGLFYNSNICGIATVLQQSQANLKETNAYQLRGMAILENYQGYGFGEALVKHIQNQLAQLNINLLWCNARTHAAQFYIKNGFIQLGDEFDIPNVGPHLCMYKKL
ncbi:MAG: hypothetical protein BM564_10965 [Bacteroidetes bacterium MedPE-SWsnd-G2]|nr:MAG: hypothetical protein BM564_10965 [Bacteroidetes bacterium MedPE-SWsnd-G2]